MALRYVAVVTCGPERVASGELYPGRYCVCFLGTHSARELRYEERDQHDRYREKCDPEFSLAYWFGLGTECVK